MKTLFDLSLIAFIIVFIVDLSGAVTSFKSFIKRIITKGKLTDGNYRLMPFDCSLCMTWWTCLLFLLITGQFTLPYIAFTCVLAFLTDTIRGILQLIKDALAIAIQKLDDTLY